MPDTLREKIESALEQFVRPMLAFHGGSIEFVSFDEPTGVLTLRFLGMCHGCALSQITLKSGIEAVMQDVCPFVTSVEAAV